MAKRFSVRYYLNLVLVDEEDRRYFKQQVWLFKYETVLNQKKQGNYFVAQGRAEREPHTDFAVYFESTTKWKFQNSTPANADDNDNRLNRQASGSTVSYTKWRWWWCVGGGSCRGAARRGILVQFRVSSSSNQKKQKKNPTQILPKAHIHTEIR